MCVSRRTRKNTEEKTNQPRKVHIQGSEKDELCGIVQCARMGMTKSVEIILAQFAPTCTALRESGLTDSVKIGLNRIVTLGIVGRNSAQQVSRGSAFRTPRIRRGTLGMPEEMTSSAKGAEGCPRN